MTLHSLWKTSFSKGSSKWLQNPFGKRHVLTVGLSEILSCVAQYGQVQYRSSGILVLSSFPSPLPWGKEKEVERESGCYGWWTYISHFLGSSGCLAKLWCSVHSWTGEEHRDSTPFFLYGAWGLGVAPWLVSSYVRENGWVCGLWSQTYTDSNFSFSSYLLYDTGKLHRLSNTVLSSIKQGQWY